MKRCIETKFFTFPQNNSGGYYIINDDVSEYLIIEAQNASEAIHKMEYITEDYSQYCPCCGTRWSYWMVEDSNGDEEPMIYDRNIRDAEENIRGNKPRVIVHYYDGTKIKHNY